MALVMALLVLLVLSSLMVALALMAQSEPVIAGNQHRAAVARAMAESGVERALWALARAGASPGAPGSLAPPASGVVAAAPYDGATFVELDVLGGFTVRVTGVSDRAARVEAVGWHPSPASLLTRAHRRIVATVARLPDLGLATPCALCVRGDLQMRGPASVTATADTSCGDKLGALTGGHLVVELPAEVRGADGNETPNQPTDYAEHGATGLGPVTLSSDDLANLRAMARASGTYYQGTVAFTASHPMPDGVVFVDTVSGDPVTGTTATSDLADVSIDGAATVHTPWHGWLVVNGSVHVAASVTLDGLIWAADALDVTAGDLAVHGLVLTGNEQTGSRIDLSGGGRADLRFDCAAARGAGAVPTGWFVKPGTYREVSD